MLAGGAKSLHIVYRAGRDNANTDTLSRNPQLPPPTEDMADTDVQITVVTTSNMHDVDVTMLLRLDPGQSVPSELALEQRQDPALAQIIAFVENDELPAEKRAKAVVAQASVLTLVDNVLYYVDSKQGNKRRIVVLVPEHLRKEENHSGPMAGHFSGNRLYNVLVRHWWWLGMYTDTLQHCKNCPHCAVVMDLVGGQSHLFNPYQWSELFKSWVWMSWTYLKLNVAINMLLCSRTS